MKKTDKLFSTGKVIVYVDGGARGNPGPSRFAIQQIAPSKPSVLNLLRRVETVPCSAYSRTGGTALPFLPIPPSGPGFL